MAHVSFTAVMNNGGIRKGTVASGKAPRRIIFMFCNLLRDVHDENKKNRDPQMNSPILPQKIFKFFAASPVPIRRSSQAFMVIGPRIAANYGL